MPDRHMPVSRRFDLSKGVHRAWPFGLGATHLKRDGREADSGGLVGSAGAVGGDGRGHAGHRIGDPGGDPAAAAASAAPAPVTAYVTNSGSGLNNGYAKQGPGTAIPVPRASMRCWPGSPYRCRRR
jgi:hypothetical protein